MAEKFAAGKAEIVGALGKYGRLEIRGAGLAVLIRKTVPPRRSLVNGSRARAWALTYASATRGTAIRFMSPSSMAC